MGIFYELFVTLAIQWDRYMPERTFEWIQAIVLAILITMSLFLRGAGNEFIYFQF